MRKFIVKYVGDNLFSGMYRTENGLATSHKGLAERFSIEDLILHRSISAELRSGLVEIIEYA